MSMAMIMEKRYLSIEDMLPLVGEFKLFQWILDSMFCIMMIPSTLQVLIMYFAALNPTWRCAMNSTMCLSNATFTHEYNDIRCSMARSDWEYTEPREFSIVTFFDIYCDKEYLIHLSSSIFFVGWVTGSVVLGWVADSFGRKIVIFPSMAMILGCGFVTPFLPNIYYLIVFRFLVGFFIPGTIVQMLVLISEMVGTKKRPLAGIILWLFFGVGLCVLALKAYFLQNWRYLFFTCTAPYLFVMLFYYFVPESLRWLRLKGNMDELMTIFKRIAEWNKKDFPKNIAINPSSSTHKRNHTPWELVRSPKTALKTINLAFAWFANGLIYYGLAIGADDLGGSVYRNFVILSAAEIPAVIVSIDFSERFGRKKTTLMSMFLGSIACLVITFIPQNSSIRIFRLILGMLGKFWFTMSLDVIYTWTMEIYPTNCRAEAMGFQQFVNKIGAASAPWIAKGLKIIHPFAPFIVMSVVGLTSSAIAILLPETRGLAMVETEDEVKDDEKNELIILSNADC